jgi:hypothetical protein
MKTKKTIISTVLRRRYAVLRDEKLLNTSKCEIKYNIRRPLAVMARIAISAVRAG